MRTLGRFYLLRINCYVIIHCVHREAIDLTIQVRVAFLENLRQNRGHVDWGLGCVCVCPEWEGGFADW